MCCILNEYLQSVCLFVFSYSDPSHYLSVKNLVVYFRMTHQMIQLTDTNLVE